VSIGGGAPELWVFDTGSMGSIINAERARALGLPQQGIALAGSPAGGAPIEGFITSVTDMHIGDVAMPPMQLAAFPSFLPDRGGVISPNTFSGRLLTLDFAASQLRISDKTPANRPSGEGYPYSGNARHRLPSVPVTVAGQTNAAHLDSGSPGALTFPYSMVASLPLTGTPVAAGHARFVDGVHDKYTAQINGDVQVGPLTLHNPEISLIDGLPFVNVGMGVLRRMTITLDPEDQRVWVSENSQN
jgi:hypothetical protein